MDKVYCKIFPPWKNEFIISSEMNKQTAFVSYTMNDISCMFVICMYMWTGAIYVCDGNKMRMEFEIQTLNEQEDYLIYLLLFVSNLQNMRWHLDTYIYLAYVVRYCCGTGVDRRGGNIVVDGKAVTAWWMVPGNDWRVGV